jgi:hypothetical protein
MDAEDEGAKVIYHVSRTVTAVMCVWPAATGKRCDGRKTRLRASSFNDARVCRGGQPLWKTQLRSRGLFFPNAMGTMRGRALGIEGVKRIGSREGGISRRVRMMFEFVSGVYWRTGVRWDGDWHLAKEGLGLSVSQAPTGSPLGKGRERWKRVVKKFVKKMEGGRIDWDLRADAQRRRAPLTIFWLDWQSGSHRQGVLGKRKIPERRLTQSTPFLKRAKIRGNGERLGDDDGEDDGGPGDVLGESEQRLTLIKKPLRDGPPNHVTACLTSASAYQ